MSGRAKTILETWMRALTERRLDDLESLYAADAVLLPTFAPRALGTPAARRAYFEQLAARPGLRVTVHDRTLRVQSSGGVEILSGIYRFEFEIDEAPLTFEARFSFVVDGAAARPILHHHSSQIPRAVT